ncbi:site-specific integrase [Devosia sp. UYZn731]|uniref:site-specific integrase n=1 Tax=Devosia sp. UYZn731 TaxID=3156345 RepID=UPI003398B032
MTIKTMLIADLGAGGDLRSEPAAKHRATTYMHFVRWRLHNGIYRNADLTPEVLEKLLADLKKRGVAKLVSFCDQIRRYTIEILEGRLPKPVMVDRRKAILDMSEVKRRVGYGHTVHLDGEAIALLNELAKSLGVHCPLKSGAKADQKTKSVLSYSAFLQSLLRLWKHRDALEHDQIGFVPFGGRKPLQVARGVTAEPPGRTKTVESLLVCTLIDHALQWVLEYSDTILKFKTNLELQLQSLAGSQEATIIARAITLALEKTEFPNATHNTPWPIGARYIAGTHTTSLPPVERVLFHLLPAACMIVIAAFSARRANEMISLQRESCQSEEESHYLSVYISKGLNDIDRIPVPSSVYKAVGVLEKLMGEEAIFLFDFKEALRNKPKGSKNPFHVRRSLSLFAAKVGPFLLEAGFEWIPKPHQLRRFFAVLYFNRFRYGHLTALSMFLRHESLDVTGRYVREAHGGTFVETPAGRRAIREARRAREDFVAVEHDFKVERLTSALKDGEMMGGWGGQAIQRQFEDLKRDAAARLELMSGDEIPEESLNRIIQLMSGSINMEPHNSGQGYCKSTNRPEDRAVAVCLREAVKSGLQPEQLQVPVSAFATGTVCVDCRLELTRGCH